MLYLVQHRVRPKVLQGPITLENKIFCQINHSEHLENYICSSSKELYFRIKCPSNIESKLQDNECCVPISDVENTPQYNQYPVNLLEFKTTPIDNECSVTYTNMAGDCNEKIDLCASTSSDCSINSQSCDTACDVNNLHTEEGGRAENALLIKENGDPLPTNIEIVTTKVLSSSSLDNTWTLVKRRRNSKGQDNNSKSISKLSFQGSDVAVKKTKHVLPMDTSKPAALISEVKMLRYPVSRFTKYSHHLLDRDISGLKAKTCRKIVSHLCTENETEESKLKANVEYLPHGEKRNFVNIEKDRKCGRMEYYRGLVDKKDDIHVCPPSPKSVYIPMKSSIGWNHGTLLLVLLLCVMAAQRSHSDLLGCREGFTKVGNHCYRLVDYQKLSFQEAAEICKSMGAKLAEIKDSHQYDVLNRDVFPKEKSIRIWIGVSEVKPATNPRQFAYLSSGKPISWGWPPGGRASSPEENCVEVEPKDGIAGNPYVWNDLSCHVRANFLCQQVPEPYAVFPFPTSDHSYTVAQHVCQSNNMMLPEPRNPTENKELFQYLGNGPPVFIGMTKGDKKGDWKWESNKEVVSYKPWETKWWGDPQPDHPDSEFCAAILRDDAANYGGKGENWGDVDCSGWGRITNVACVYAVPGCLDGFMKYGSHCYKLDTRAAQLYKDADYVCKRMGAELAEPTTNDQFEWMENNVFPKNWAIRIWLGITKQGGIWRYLSNNEPISWARYAPGGPNGNGACMFADPRGKKGGPFFFNYMSCKLSAYPVCQHKESSRPREVCPFVSLGHKCYKFVTDGFTRDKPWGHGVCKKHGLDDLELGTLEELNIISKYIGDHHPTVRNWRMFGAKKESFVSKWQWSDGSQINANMWINNNPKTQIYGSALLLTKIGKTSYKLQGGWMGSKANYPSYSYPFICESMTADTKRAISSGVMPELSTLLVAVISVCYLCLVCMD